MEKSEERREADLRKLADRLQFSVTRSGDRFTLIRTADVSRPVQEVDLSLSDAENLLETWKLRVMSYCRTLTA